MNRERYSAEQSVATVKVYGVGSNVGKLDSSES